MLNVKGDKNESGIKLAKRLVCNQVAFFSIEIIHENLNPHLMETVQALTTKQCVLNHTLRRCHNSYMLFTTCR